jgi:hypothetical protein
MKIKAENRNIFIYTFYQNLSAQQIKWLRKDQPTIQGNSPWSFMSDGQPFFSPFFFFFKKSLLLLCFLKL